MSDRQTLARVIKNTATYYGRTLDPEVLSMMCDDLSDLPFDSAITAYEVYRKNPKNRAFPLPAQIREIVNPGDYISAEDQAAEIAARIISAVPGCGWNNGRDAERYIGPIGWSIVQRQGGWSYICENLGTRINPSTFQAQLRKQIEGSIRYGEDAIAKVIGAAPTRGDGGLTQIGDVMKLITNKQGEE